MRSNLSWVLILVVIALVAAAKAEDFSIVNIGWQVVPFQSLSISNASAKTVSDTFIIPQPTPQDLKRGYIEKENAIVLIAKSNVNWVINVRTPNSDMGVSFDGTYVKPISDFQLRAGGSYLTVSYHDQMLAKGPHGEHEIGVNYKVLFGEDHRDGNYKITLIYTITTG
jgi:hypothetical protein